MKPRFDIAFNPEAARIIIAAMVCATAFFGSLLVTKVITWDQFLHFLSILGGYVAGQVTPSAINYFFRKPLPADFSISEPPPKGDADADSRK